PFVWDARRVEKRSWNARLKTTERRTIISDPCGDGQNYSTRGFVAPPSRRLSGGRPARRSEGRMPSGQPAKPALSEVEGMPALRKTTWGRPPSAVRRSEAPHLMAR